MGRTPATTRIRTASASCGRCGLQELSGIAIQGPDGLPDLMLDSFDRGVVELRIRGDAGAKGRRARRVPIVMKLGAEMGRHR